MEKLTFLALGLVFLFLAVLEENKETWLFYSLLSVSIVLFILTLLSITFPNGRFKKH